MKILVFLMLGFAVYAEPSPNAFQVPLSLAKTAQAPQLLIFVSFSMPEHSLKLWAKQAESVNGKVLIRGFIENSFSKTALRMRELFKDDKTAEWLIDPESFERYGIKAVPAVVITQSTDGMVETAELDFDVSYGDTSLKDALALIAVKGSAYGQKSAQTLLQRIKQHEN